MSIENELRSIFDAERALRAAETRFFAAGDEKNRTALLAAAVEEARSLDDRAEAVLRLERLADLCAQVAGPTMVDALITILDDEEPSVRVAAGEALLDLGYERYAEVARGIERRLEQETSGLSLSELPLILAEIGEPSALPLIRRFLAHDDAEVVAAGIEALARLGDPGAIPDLEKLVDDEREVGLEEFEEETTATLGELARETIEELEEATE